MSIQEDAAASARIRLVADPQFREEFRTQLAEAERGGDGKPAILYARHGTDPMRVSAGGIGAELVTSRTYRSLMARFPGGGPSASQGAWMSDPVPVDLRLRTIVTSADTSAGDLVRPDWRGIMEGARTRPIRVPNLVTIIPTTSDSVEYAKELSRQEAAVTVAEASALTGTTGTKPEGGVVFDQVSDSVKTFAIWLAATKAHPVRRERAGRVRQPVPDRRPHARA